MSSQGGGAPVLVLDRDGTLTRIKGYARELAQDMATDFPWLGLAAEVERRLEHGMRALCADPERTVCLVPAAPGGGRAAADSLIAAQVAAQDVLRADAEAARAIRACYPSAACAVTAYTTALHHKHKGAAAEYREGAQAYVRRLMEEGAAVYVVTNSGTEEISRALLAWEDSEAGAWLAARVRGGAKKFVVEPGSETLRLPGLRRAVSAVRPHYEDILRDIMQAERAAPEDVTVMGDLLEFDLLVPLRLGMRVVLVGDTALEYERQYVASSPGGAVRATPWAAEQAAPDEEAHMRRGAPTASCACS